MFIISSLSKRLFGSRNQRVIKKLYKTVAQINALEKSFEALDDLQLRAKTDEFKNRLESGEGIDDLLVEAFAVVREASKRTLNLRPFDVQLIGGMILHSGKISEMCTGEGKTLVATLPAYLNALAGKGVHIITVNDYLAKRDAAWMEPVYNFLGLSVGVNISGMEQTEKQAAYRADITYGTNNEFGFDYLRDNMAFDFSQRVQRDLFYGIVDEVDSILIDEARTPLIISGPTEDSSELYIKVNNLIPKLKLRETEEGSGDYYLDEKQKQAHLTEEGHQHIEELMYKDKLIQADESLYDPANIRLMHHLGAALRANKLFHRDVDYIVSNGEVVIVDEHTGRTMPGRRWSDGLHQAVEAKEGVHIRSENQTLATITFQNYFRLYQKLSGMTGTADTEAYELQQIYGLEVIVIPTNRPLIRKDAADKVYLSQSDKFKAIVNEIKDCVFRGQPVLVGTASIETSEYLSNLLKQSNIAHEVLNAKQHEREAKIIALAGKPSAVTIATNMAGRGTDIVLGGNLDVELSDLEEAASEDLINSLRSDWQKRHQAVISSGGLHVLGSERHESRRIDNQLRGRSGRQGDPGSSRFYVSLEDNLMRIFASERVSAIMKRLGMHTGEAIEHPWITKAIANAQRKVEGYHFDVRKHLLEFDNVANDQRKIIYHQRDELMSMDDISDALNHIREDVIEKLAAQYVPHNSNEDQWNVFGLQDQLINHFKLSLPLVETVANDDNIDASHLSELINEKLTESYLSKRTLVGAETMQTFEKTLLLQTLDSHWKEHLANMDYLRHSIHLSGYAQKDPKQEYKKEAFALFTTMLDQLKFEVIRILSNITVQTQDEVDALEAKRLKQANPTTMVFRHESSSNAELKTDERDLDSAESNMPLRTGAKVGRNAICPCGSGKKYKQCCGKL